MMDHDAPTPTVEELKRTLSVQPAMRRTGMRNKMTFIGNTNYELGKKNAAEESVINGVLLLKDKVDKEKLKNLVRERLLVFDRFRCVIQEEAGVSYWAEVETVDLDYHVTEAELPEPRDQKAVDKFVSDLTARSMDYDRPLFRFYIFNNFKGDGAEACVLWRIHHSIADGTTLVQVFFRMMDKTDEEKVQKAAVKKAQAPSIWSQIADPVAFARRSVIMVEGLADALGLAALPADSQTLIKLKHTKDLSVQKVCARSDPISLSMIKDIKNVMGTTVNDVFVAMVTGAVRRYLEKRGDPYVLSGKAKIRGIFPFNMRRGGADITIPKNFGNQFTFVPITFPMNVTDSIELLRECKALCDDLKVSPVALLLLKMNELVGKVLPKDQYIRQTEEIFEKITINFTNVPGPQVPVTLCGNQVEDIMFYVPGPNGHVLSVISYNGKISLGILSDPKLIPDPSQLAQCFTEEIKELHRAVTEGPIPPKPLDRRLIARCIIFYGILYLVGLFHLYAAFVLFYLIYTRIMHQKNEGHHKSA